MGYFYFSGAFQERLKNEKNIFLFQLLIKTEQLNKLLYTFLSFKLF